MNTQKLLAIVERGNDRLEEQTTRAAEVLISNILAQRQRIKEIEADILDMQDQLKNLEVTRIEPKDVLGNLLP